jgi:N-acetylglucosaminyldiphosphoundecaprenol N-acetyl-beta-D-mannosaminyltransferase
MKKTHYICVLNTRALYHAKKNTNYNRVINNSLLTVPDGKPLAIIANLRGFGDVKKTAGPVLFRKLCELSQKNNYSHFFYGSTPEIISKMTTNLMKEFEGIDIRGAVSPPFGSAEDLVTDEIISQINHVKPTFLWLGLGAPKQEIVASILKEKLEATIIIGIGLVFEYEAGTVKRPAKWVQDSGFEWLHRVFQQFPRTKYFVIPFCFMVSQLVLEFIKSKLRK